MKELTEVQYNSLVYKIFQSFMANPDNGLGEVNDCKEESERIVGEWMQENDLMVFLDGMDYNDKL